MLDPRGHEFMSSCVKTQFQWSAIASLCRALAGERRSADEVGFDTGEGVKRRRWPRNVKTVPNAVLPYTWGDLSSF